MPKKIPIDVSSFRIVRADDYILPRRRIFMISLLVEGSIFFPDHAVLENHYSSQPPLKLFEGDMSIKNEAELEQVGDILFLGRKGHKY